MLYVDGKWVNSDKSFDVISPVTGNLLGTVPVADEELVRAAIDAAESAKETWRSTPRSIRAKLLVEVGNQPARIMDDLTMTITMEMGKPLVSARTEVEKSTNLLVQTAEQIKRFETSFLPCEDVNVSSFTKAQRLRLPGRTTIDP